MKNNYLFLLFVGIVLFVFDGKAQVNLGVTAGGTSEICQAGAAVTLNCTYIPVNGTTGYTVSSISPNSPFSTNPPFATSLTTDDDWSQVIDLKGAGATPFNFCFFGNNYTKCLLNTNGVISFSIGSGPSAVPGGVYTPGGGAGYTLSQPIPFNPGASNAPYLNAIHGVFQDTYPTPTTNINYYVNGTYPNRAFIFSMNDVPNFSCSSVRQSSQIVMYEGTNIIDVYVIKRDNSCSWQGGRAVLGVQNNSGTVGFTPPGRNTGSWAVPASTPEAWRFKPNAGAPVPVTLVWKDQLGNVVGTGANPTVYPTATTTYTVEATYTICGLNYTVTDDVTVTITDIQTGTPSDIPDADCNSIFDLTVNTAPVMASLDPSQYIITYHTTFASANGNNDAEIPAGMLSNFLSTGQPIWVAVEDFFSSFACRKVQQFNLIPCGATPTVSVNSPSACQGDSVTVTATPGTAGSYTYAWTVPAGFTNPGNVSTFSTTVPGTYSVIITDTVSGLSSTGASGTVTINALPTVTVDSPTVCGTTATITATPGTPGTYTYTWTVPAGATNPGNTASFSTTIPGTYSVDITNLTTTCTSASASGTVTINTLPTVTVNSPTVCGTSATVTATPGIAGTYNYVWTVPAGATNPGNVASFTTTTAGTYSVVITNPSTTCSSASASGTVTINEIPTVTVNSPVVCGSSATISATPNPAAGTYSYAWTVPAGATNPGNTASFSTTIPGTYSVVVTNTTTTCSSASASGSVTINPLPTVSVNNSSICSGETATVTATPGVPGTYTYTWTVPAGVTNPGNVASFTTTTAGTYSVVITNPTTTCSSASASGTVTASPAGGSMNLQCGAYNSATGELYIDWSNVSGITTFNYSYSINGGPVINGTQNSPSSIYIVTNGLPITFTLSGVGSVCVPTQTITCGCPAPAINPVNVSACSGQVVNQINFATSDPYDTVSWTNSNPAIGLAASGTTNFLPSFTAATVTTPQTATITVTLTKYGCAGPPRNFVITINPLPTVTVNSPSVCSGTNATVTATPGVAGTYNYVWTVPVGVTNPGNVASFTTTTAGNYSVIITNPTTTCSSASASGTVTVNALPTVTVNTSTVCVGTAATVTATPGIAGTYNYVWTVPTGVTNPGNVASFTTTTAGTYSVIITNPTTTCSSASASGTVNNYAVPTVSVNSPSACSGASATITATPGVAGPYTYAWTVPTGATNPGNVASFTTTMAGTYSVIITNTTTTCSSASASGTVTINPLPTVTVNSPSVCSGTNATVTATPGVAGTYNYTWTVPVGVTNPGNVASFTTTTAGNYSVIITNPTTTCSSASASGTVTVNALPTVTVNTSTVCVGTAATVTATPGVAGTYNYVWTVPTGVTNPGNVASFTTTTAGTYSVIITNPTTTCSSASASGTVNNYAVPTVSVNSPSACSGASATITATPGVAGPYTYAWTVPTGATNPGNVASFTTTMAGTYSVIITNTTTTCSSASASGTVTINALPTVTVNSPSVCSGTNATVTATPGVAGTYNYTWTVPVGVTNPGNIASFTTTTAGNYSVIITNPTTTCSSASASGTVTVNALPTVTVNTSTVCVGTVATVTATPGIAGSYNYVWTVPTGVTNPGNVASFATTTAGTYSVIITNPTTTCSSASASGTVNNYAVPTVSVNSPSICSGASATITATPGVAGPYTYAWTVPTGVTNPGSVASFTTSTPGAYSVIITNTTTGCSSALATGNVTISQTPTVIATPTSESLCSGQSTGIQLQSNVPNTTFTWTYTQTGGVTGASNGSGNIISQVLTAATVTGTVIYTITPVSPGSCTGIPTTVTVTVTPVPTVNVNTIAQSICTGDTTNITMTSSIPTTTFGWNVVQAGGVTGGTNGTGTSINDVLVASGNTIGQAIYTITPINNGCPGAPKTVIVTVYPKPIVTASVAQTTICSGQTTSIALASNVPGTTFSWTVAQTGIFGAASGSGNAINQTLSTVGLTQGTVTYTITPTVNGCTGDSITVTITVNPTPEVFSSSGPQVICSGISSGILITPNIPGTTIEWTVVQSGVTGAANGSASETTPGAGIPIDQVLTATGTTFGTATYTITPINNGCSGTPITVVVKVNPLPHADIKGGTVCIDVVTGDLISGYLMDTELSETDYDFQWYFGTNMTDIIGTNSSYTATEAGQYTVYIMNATTGCSDVFIVDVTESNPAQSATYIVTNYFEDDQAITITVVGNGTYEYELDHSGIWQTSNVFPHVLPGEHTVAIRDINGCTDIVLEHIWTIGYPHFFTPNGDGYNETWNIWSLKDDQPNAEIHIFDRYGKLIKQIIPAGNGWDGTYNGQLLPSTDYWFTVKFMENGVERIFKAHFSMKR